MLGGVSAALAAHLGWPVRRVRTIFVIGTLVMGAGALLYAWLWALTPLEQDGESSQPVRRSVPTSALLVAAGFIAAVVAVALANTANDPYLATVLAIVLTGSAVAFSLTLDREDSGRTASTTSPCALRACRRWSARAPPCPSPMAPTRTRSPPC